MFSGDGTLQLVSLNPEVVNFQVIQNDDLDEVDPDKHGKLVPQAFEIVPGSISVPDSGPDAGGSCFYYAFDPALKFLC
jgi:hypothetical protein